MEHTIFDTSIWGLIWQSDIITKTVLLILLVLSIFCWAIALYKFILLRIKKAQCNAMIRSLHSVHTFQDIHALALSHAHTLPGYFLSQFLSIVKKILVHQKQHQGNLQNYTQLLQEQTAFIFEEIMMVEESSISFLTMSASVAPLLGLFGTVWGLIHSFLQIAQKQSADIVTVAPGISEALITTIAGLVVAIPALMVGYYLTLQVRKIEQNMMQVADKCLFVTQLFLAQHHTSLDMHAITSQEDIL